MVLTLTCPVCGLALLSVGSEVSERTLPPLVWHELPVCADAVLESAEEAPLDMASTGT